VTPASVWSTLVGIPLGVAVTLTVLMWTVEAFFGRRVGVYLGCATILVVGPLTAYLAYAELMLCHIGESPPFPQCEWHPFVDIFIGCLALLTVPTLVVSTIVLKKWSDARNKRVA
jgi:hypothetical protein